MLIVFATWDFVFGGDYSYAFLFGLNLYFMFEFEMFILLSDCGSKYGHLQIVTKTGLAGF